MEPNQSLLALDAEPDDFVQQELELFACEVACESQGIEDPDISENGLVRYGISPLLIIAIINVSLKILECIKDRRNNKDRAWRMLQHYANENRPFRKLRADARINRMIEKRIKDPSKAGEIREALSKAGSSLTRERFDRLYDESIHAEDD